MAQETKGKQAADRSLSNFLLGLEATFGWIIEDEQEHADFLASAEEFYHDYRGSNGVLASTRLPFWRYLIHYSGVGLDHAASAGRSSISSAPVQLGTPELEDLGNAMACYWPLIPALVQRTWTAPAYAERSTGAADQATKVDTAVQTDGSSSSSDEAGTPQACPDPTARPVFTTRIPEVPPVSYNFALPSPSPSSTPTTENGPLLVGSPSAIRPSSRRASSYQFNNGRSQSSSTYQSSVSETGSTPTLEYTSSMDSRSRTSSSNSSSMQDGLGSIPLATPTPSMISAEPTLILADRGDNAARLYPTTDGAYILHVSIGGRKLVYNPDKPAEICYHDVQGQVVTRSLLDIDEGDEAVLSDVTA